MTAVTALAKPDPLSCKCEATMCSHQAAINNLVLEILSAVDVILRQRDILRQRLPKG